MSHVRLTAVSRCAVDGWVASSVHRAAVDSHSVGNRCVAARIRSYSVCPVGAVQTTEFRRVVVWDTGRLWRSGPDVVEKVVLPTS